MATSQPTPLIVVVGETGSGKSALALEIAKRFNGEIICADARTVYKGMDIGTAKPSLKEQERVPHHLIDLVTPDIQFTAADFKAAALKAIKLISARGKLPILVGGSGLYIDAVLFDYTFLPKTDEKYRQKLQQLMPKELMAELNTKNIAFEHVDSKNPRRLQRLLETEGQTGGRQSLRPGSFVLGISLPRAELRRRLETRLDQMLRTGLKGEALSLADRYGWEAPGLNAIGYREWRRFQEGDSSNNGVRAAILSAQLNLAKRQRTWFKRNRSIEWVSTVDEAMERTEHFLAAEANLLQ